MLWGEQERGRLKSAGKNAETSLKINIQFLLSFSVLRRDFSNSPFLLLEHINCLFGRSRSQTSIVKKSPLWCSSLQPGEPGHRGDPKPQTPQTSCNCGPEASRRRSARRISSQWGHIPKDRRGPGLLPPPSSRVIQRLALVGGIFPRNPTFSP